MWIFSAAFFYLALASSIVVATPLDTAIDGIYKLQVSCFPGTASCTSANMAHVDRITVVDTHSPLGVWVTFASAAISDFVDTFLGCLVDNTGLAVTGSPHLGSGFGSGGPGRFSYLNVTFDPLTGTLDGSLMDARVADTYHITGTKIRAVGDLHSSGPVPNVPLAQILGSYRGTFSGSPATLLIRSRPDGLLVGYFAGGYKFGGSPILQFNYFSGLWDPALGIMHLYFLNDRFIAVGEMALRLRINSKGFPGFDGFQFTMFADNPVVMDRVP